MVQSTVETINPTRVRLTVEVPFDELKPSLDAAYKKINRQVTVPGFRKGRVPPRIIDQRFGRAVVLEEAVNDALPQLYTNAVRDNNIRVLGQPEVDVKQFADGEQLTFTAEVDVQPEFELPEYRGLAITVDDATVTDEQVDEELDRLRERFGSLVTVERPAAAGDFVTIDLSAVKDGEEIEDAQGKGMSYEIGSGSLLDGLDDALSGLSAGESKTFHTKLVGGSRGGEVDVTATVSAVRERSLPPLDDDFAMMASEFDTLEELRVDLRTRLERAAQVRQVSQARDRTLEAVLESVDLPVPEGIIKDAVARRQHDIEHQFGHDEAAFAAFLERDGRAQEDLTADFTEEAQRSLKAEFILDAIADAENIAVSEGELGDHIVRTAMRYGVRPDEFAQQVIDAGQQGMLVGEVRRGKALDVVVEAATITDESGNGIDVNEIISSVTARMAAERAGADEDLEEYDELDDLDSEDDFDELEELDEDEVEDDAVGQEAAEAADDEGGSKRDT